jgi:peptidyl-tRNA hydrolase, PTH1 family
LADPWLVAGLGNPGERYARTRHNVGALVVENLAHRQGARLKKVRFLPLQAAASHLDGVPVRLVAPGTFMNVSGPPIASLARKRGVPVERVVACHDDLDLAFGALRIKRGGSTAGHHGLDSLVEAFHSADFFRVRVGIGRPPGRQDPVRFVLEQFAKREWEEITITVEAAADAVHCLVTRGLIVTQDRYNRGGIRER